jgi:hypothetical protein
VRRVAFKREGDPLGRQPCLRTPFMHRILPPSEPPDGEHSRRFCLAVVGGTQLRGSWYLSAIARLQGFSSGSPAASPRRWSPKTVTTSLMVGRSKPGCAPCPALSFKDLHHPDWGGGRGEPELQLSHGSADHLFFQLLGVETIPQLYRGGALQPCRGRRTVAAQLGCNILSSILAFVARTGVRTCRCALGRPALTGAALVIAGESFSVDKSISATRGPTSGSLALMSGLCPLSGDANESLLAAASVLGPSLLLQRSLASRPELVAPQALRCGGCSYPREWNRSSVCNGTLSAGVCSLWLSGPEHVCIFGMKPCFFLISSTRTHLSAN